MPISYMQMTMNKQTFYLNKLIKLINKIKKGKYNDTGFLKLHTSLALTPVSVSEFPVIS